MASPSIPQPAASYTLAAGGVLASDGRYIPAEQANLDYQAYLAWIAAGHTASADPQLVIEAVRTVAKRAIDLAADARRLALLPAGPSSLMLNLLRYQEAALAHVDGLPIGANYPVINAEVGHNGATLADVAVNVLAEQAALKIALAAIEAVRQVTRDAVTAASTPSAVAAVLAAISWP
jgi:hypothetical protein